MPLRSLLPLAAAIGGLVLSADMPVRAAPPDLAFPGEAIDTWHGHRRHTFAFQGRKAWVVEPDRPLPGNPWSWCMMFPDAFVDRCAAPQLLAAGFHHAFLDVGNTFGAPAAIEALAAFRDDLVRRGLASRVALIGISRGGLYAHRYAAEHPDHVAVIYGDNPVCDFKSWPGGKGTGKGSPQDWAACLACYGFADEAAALAYPGNPVDALQPLARAGVAIIDVVGDRDDVVPPAENALVVAERYRTLGGTIEVIREPGKGHHPHGLAHPRPVVDFILVHAAKAGGAAGASVAAPAATDRPHEVAVADGLTLRDAAREKDVPYKVSFPKDHGPYPLIVFSHGFGGNKDAFATVSRHWAGQGYVVIQPTHADGLGRRDGDRNAGGDRPGRLWTGGLLAGLNDPDRIADRVADLVLILDSLAEIERANPGLEGRIDASRIGVGGHSFGAYTAMLIGGVTVDLGDEKGGSFRDERVTCILPISAQGTGQQGLTDASWARLTIPMMTITGTRDQGVGGQGVDWRKEPYRFSPPGAKYLVVIDGANHFSFGGGLGARSSDVTDVVNLTSTLFWDAFLRDSEPARARLDSDRLPEESGGNYTFEKK